MQTDSKLGHILKYWGLDLQHMNWGGGNKTHNMKEQKHFLQVVILFLAQGSLKYREMMVGCRHEAVNLSRD